MRKKDEWFWREWESNIALQLCSLAAQGLWMHMLSVMSRSKKRGFLLDGENQMDIKMLAKIARSTVEEIEPLLKELESHGVFSRLPDGTIYSAQMINGAELSEIRSRAGRRGGRPRKQNEKQNEKQIEKQNEKQIEKQNEKQIGFQNKKQNGKQNCKLLQNKENPAGPDEVFGGKNSKMSNNSEKNNGRVNGSDSSSFSSFVGFSSFSSSYNGTNSVNNNNKENKDNVNPDLDNKVVYLNSKIGAIGGVIGGDEVSKTGKTEEIQKIMRLWNEFAERHNLAKITKIKPGSERQRHLLARMKEPDWDFEKLLSMVEKSPFLLGKKGKEPFFVTFDWLLWPGNYERTLEGNYLEREKPKNFWGDEDDER